MSSQDKVIGVRELRTLKDFLDVFPDELHSLPPDREVEFTIDLYLDILPMSITPYRMTPKELKE